MADDLNDAFVPIKDTQGRVTGVMDRMTADYLASTAPNPTQAGLDLVFSRATRVRLLGERLEGRRYVFDVVRLEVCDATDLAELQECLRIVENPESYGHLMAFEDHHLELWAGEEQLCRLAIVRWCRLRWRDVWQDDARLVDPRKFAAWLLAQGIADAMEELKRREG